MGEKELPEDQAVLGEDNDNGNTDGNGNGDLESIERKMLGFLWKHGMRHTGWLAENLKTSKRDIIDIARRLSNKGYALEIRERDGVITLVREGQMLPEFISVEDAARHFKILFFSELRAGAKQSQMSLVHWIYEHIVKPEGIKLAVSVGGLVAGRPTKSVAMDLFKLTPQDQADWVVQHFPKSDTCKTYVVSGRREETWRGQKGFDVVRAICANRDDMVWAGDFERTFKVRDVLIKVMTPWDDNAPIGKSYGPQTNSENLTDDPFPDIVIYGATHTRQDIPAWVNGAHVYTVPSLHKQMKRQRNRKVSPRIGCFMLELFFDKNWKLERHRGHHINLNFPELVRDSDHLKGFDDLDTAELVRCIVDEGEREQVLTILKELFDGESGLSKGELSRRLKVSRKTIDQRLNQLSECGFEFDIPAHTKHVVVTRVEKDVFQAPAVDPSDIFRWKTRESNISDTHFGSTQELPELVALAYKEAAAARVRRMFHAGDHSDGAGGVGYRGHLHDVKMTRSDDMEDHEFACWPQVKVKLDSAEPPVLQTRLIQNPDGSIGYEEYWVHTGEAVLQTELIDGNHDGWGENSIGHCAGRALAFRLPDHIRYLGSQSGTVVVDGVYYQLLHPRGGLGYTLSTKLQGRYAPAMRKRGEGAGLPKVLKAGNYHVAYAMLDDDIDMEYDPCYKWEDQFHVTLGLVSWIGMWIVERYAHPSGKWSRVIREYRNHFPLAQELMKSR